MLAVSDRQEAQKIFFAVQNAAGWTLQLRPVANATDTPIRRRRQPSRCSRDNVTLDQRLELLRRERKSEQIQQRTQRTRIYFTGDCEGFTDLREALRQPPRARGRRLERPRRPGRRRARRRAPRTASCTGRGPSRSRAARWPRSGSRPAAPIIIVASSTANELLEEALDGRRRRRARPAAADRERRLRDPQGRSCASARRPRRAPRRPAAS